MIKLIDNNYIYLFNIFFTKITFYLSLNLVDAAKWTRKSISSNISFLSFSSFIPKFSLTTSPAIVATFFDMKELKFSPIF
jgi:hypothetical protein